MDAADVVWLCADADPRVERWFASLAHTYRHGAELVQLLGTHPWDSVRADCSVHADRLLSRAEAQGLIVRGKLDMSPSQRAFSGLELGGARAGRPAHAYAARCAWTLSEDGLALWRPA